MLLAFAVTSGIRICFQEVMARESPATTIPGKMFQSTYTTIFDMADIHKGIHSCLEQHVMAMLKCSGTALH